MDAWLYKARDKRLLWLCYSCRVARRTSLIESAFNAGFLLQHDLPCARGAVVHEGVGTSIIMPRPAGRKTEAQVWICRIGVAMEGTLSKVLNVFLLLLSCLQTVHLSVTTNSTEVTLTWISAGCGQAQSMSERLAPGILQV